MSKKKVKLDKKYIESIEGYGDEIITIEDPVKHVRLRPGMYIGPREARGLLNMIREIYQNSVDQLMRRDSPCDTIRVTFDENTLITVIEDNGMGVPFNKMVRVYSDHRTSSNYVKEKGQYSSGLNGVGAKVVNALSKWMIAESYSMITGDGRKVEFKDGHPTTKNPTKIKNPDNKHGTMVSFQPEEKVMGNMNLSYKTVLYLIRDIMSLTNIGNSTIFKAIKKDGTVYEETIVNEDGILSTLIHITDKPIIAPIFINGDNGTMKADMVFTYDAEDLESDKIVAYANFCPTSTGTHIVGFEEGLGKFFRNYMNNIYLKSNKIRVNISDIRSGLKAMISVAHLEPDFTGQAKDELSNADMRPYIRDLTNDTLEGWAKSNPNDLLKIAKHLKDIATVRVKSEEGRVKITQKYKQSAVTGLPSKYKKPNGKKDLELVIVEGDSAAGSAHMGRDKNKQGIFPIKGKIIQVFTSTGKLESNSKVLNNEEVQGLIRIIEGGYGKNFDISKVKFSKIIILTDADSDGSHIRTLLIGFFARYMYPLLEAGMIYSAVPPLYGLKKGKKTEYFTDKLDYVKYIQNLFMKNNKIESIKGEVLNKAEVTSLLYKNVDYTYELSVVSRTYAIDPYLLEFILVNRELSLTNLRKQIKKAFRFVNDIEKKGNSIIINGLVDGKIQMVILNDRLLHDSRFIIDIIDSNISVYYKLNGEVSSIYHIMNVFENVNKNTRLTHYKGLGEMDDKQLGDSTLHPDANRTLIQYTLSDVSDDMQALRAMQSAEGRKKLLKLAKVTRQDIIG